MAYDSNNLSALSYANGQTVWGYRTRVDHLGKVLEPGYFNAAAGMLPSDDPIFISASTGPAFRFIQRSTDGDIELVKGD